MNEMQLFENPEFGKIRVIEKDGEPWFVAADVCRALEHSNVTVALDRLDEDERAKFNLGRQGDTWCVNEPGLYSLVLGSRKPEAKAFKRWITHDVIPSIRKHGMYAKDELLNNPDLMIEILTQIKEERQQRIEAEKQKNKLQMELDRSKEWFSIKRVAAINGVSWKTFNWRKLKKISDEIGQPSRKIFDANYGEVNIYHAKAWEKAYPEYEL